MERAIIFNELSCINTGRVIRVVYKKNNIFTISLIFFIILTFGQPVFAAKPWTLGLIFGLEGFNQQASEIFDSEYFKSGLYFDPFSVSRIRGALMLSALIPFNPFNSNMIYLGGGVEIQLLNQSIHDDFFFRSWRYSPSLAAEVFIKPFGEKNYYFLISLQPLRVWFSDSIVSTMGVEMMLDSDGQLKGWGICLFRLITFVR